MSDIGCSCIYTTTKRWDDDRCPHPEHGRNYQAGRTVRVGMRSYRPGELISIEDI